MCDKSHSECVGLWSIVNCSLNIDCVCCCFFLSSCYEQCLCKFYTLVRISLKFGLCYVRKRSWAHMSRVFIPFVGWWIYNTGHKTLCRAARSMQQDILDNLLFHFYIFSRQGVFTINDNSFRCLFAGTYFSVLIFLNWTS